jgi:hypothetical protein
MLIGKEKFKFFLLICKLLALLLLPFLLSTLSLDELESKPSICLFKNLFGIECYGCGITKAVIAITQLDCIRAFHYNKLIVIVMPLIFFLWIKEIVKCVKVVRKKITEKHWKICEN